MHMGGLRVIQSIFVAIMLVYDNVFLQTGIGITIAGGATIDNPASNIYIKKIVDINSPLKKGENIIKVCLLYILVLFCFNN